MSPKQRALIVAIYATAMGYLEAAVVYYLRTMVNRLDPHQAHPLPEFGAIGPAELWREAATLIMLVMVGWLAGKTWRGRVGFSLIAFGIWDIAYYIFLIPLTGWPKSLLDWDILFLIPLPWWGPVLAPVSIALLMIAFGALATILELGEPPIWPRKIANMLCVVGVFGALYVFMRDAIAVAPQGEAALRNVLPETFHWTGFVTAWLLMAVPVADMTWQLATRYR
jgi:hypothetical protein